MSRARELARLGNINAIAADPSNNIGLGTTASIQYKLYVIGDANFTGVVTASSFGGNLTGTPQLGTGVTVYSSGIVSATSFQGDGSNLTGVAATDNINTNAIQVSGITTFQSLMEPFDFWMFSG